ncbi:universal stress protein [Streptomyces sp. NPDC000348]|uniref:universal stress protein n=1 Tax=Streptomyces sp. NPDC000348 TaxID=3364538 RepID=UPI003674F59B
MPRTVTVGLDGSSESLAAAEWAAAEAELRGLPLHLVHAWDWQPYIRAVPSDTAQRQWGGRVLREATERLHDRHPGLEITSEQVRRPPVTALLAASAEADPLVIGSRGLSGVAGFLVGSVGLALTAETDRPVVLVRSGARVEDGHRPDADGRPSAGTPYRDVVLGLDPERPAEAVIAFAFEAAARRAAGLRVVHGWSMPSYLAYGLTGDTAPDDETARREAGAVEGVLAPWREKFPGVRVVEQSAVGNPGAHLVDAAADASLIVIGRRTRHTSLGVRIGPVAHAVLHHATAPVAVVPHE